MKFIGIIPARMASTRFPGKPLARLCGMTMIEHVFRRAGLCRALSEVLVATCDQEIADEVRRFGGKAIMTSDKHPTCTDRVAEACRNIASDADVVVNIQGDEPLIDPSMIEATLQPFLRDPALDCANAISRIDSEEDFRNPNTIKVVRGLGDWALYFSREPIPSSAKFASPYDRFKQVCILPFRREFLLRFVDLPVTPLEKVESIDMLRILEHGHRIKLVEVHGKTVAVDTALDREKAELMLQRDALFDLYGRPQR